MSEQQQKCVKCGGEMTAGRSIAFGELQRIYSSIWMEHKIRDFSPLSFFSDDIEKYSIATYRCIECGYLESYATERTY